MKKFLLSTTALFAMTAMAAAADLPARTVAPAPLPVAAPVFTWSGFYVGVNAGYGFSDDRNFGSGGNLTVPAFGGGTFAVAPAGGGNFFNGRNDNSDGFVGGGQVGFNVQAGMFVFGIEADAQYVDIGGGRGGFGDNGGFGTAVPGGAAPGVPGVGVAGVVPGAPGNVAFFNTGNNVSSIDSLVTVRGRVGLAFDRFLVYGTGGVAWAGYDNDNAGTGFITGNSVPTPFYVGGGAAAAGRGVIGTQFRGDSDEWGYVVGGGVEFAFTNNLSAKIEGLYVDMGTTRGFGTNTPIVGVTNTGAAITANDLDGRSSTEFAIIRGGLNFRFNTF
jgi:outer membrane immunogenic protein